MQRGAVSDGAARRVCSVLRTGFAKGFCVVGHCALSRCHPERSEGSRSHLRVALEGVWGKHPPGQTFSPAVREAICAARRPPRRSELRECRDTRLSWGAGAVEADKAASEASLPITSPGGRGCRVLAAGEGTRAAEVVSGAQAPSAPIAALARARAHRD